MNTKERGCFQMAKGICFIIVCIALGIAQNMPENNPTPSDLVRSSVPGLSRWGLGNAFSKDA